MTDKGHGHPVKPRAWYRTRWFTTLVVVAAFVVIAIVAVVPVGATDTISYCASCKYPGRAEKTWEASPHRDVACTSCHIPSGFTAQLKWRLQEARNIWSSYLSVDRVAEKAQYPGNDNCLKCHPLEKIPDEGNGVRMSHEVHVDLRGLTCADCHDTVSHTKANHSTGVTMQTCPMCHNDMAAPGDCDFCHPSPPTDTHRPDYLKEHGREARLNVDACLRCHHDKAEFCDACHASPPPDHFSSDWRFSHETKATDDPKYCQACHTVDYCAQCHAVSHPDDWEIAHGSIAAQGPAACLVCHPQAMCDTCHEQRGVTP